ncbi:MAG TPA: YciI family protein [Verrucomicrobiae bacterium]
MNNQKPFMLIFRGNEWHRTLSPEEMQRVYDQWMAWFKGLIEDGSATAGNPLEDTGKVVSGPQGRVVADGPFAESKEAIGGYFLLLVEDMDAAVRIAQQCPGLPYGAKVEVRPVAGDCPLNHLSQTAAAALAQKYDQDMIRI